MKMRLIEAVFIAVIRSSLSALWGGEGKGEEEYHYCHSPLTFTLLNPCFAEFAPGEIQQGKSSPLKERGNLFECTFGLASQIK